MAIVAPIVSTFDSRGVRQAGRAFDGLRRNVGNALRATAQAAAVFGVAASAGIVKSVSAASDLNEAISATEQIFGDAAEDVLAFSRTAAESIGQSQQTVLDAAMTFGTFGKAAGLAGEDLSKFTNDFVTLASDIASFRNASPEEVIEAIGAGLRGESEPLRRFGVLLDDATLKAEALALGIYDGTGALSQQQKILAAEAAIYKQTTDAQGDFLRTSDGLANSSRILRARLDNITAQIGQAFLPIALKLTQVFLDRVIPAVEALADAFTEDGLLGAMRMVWEWIRENAPAIGQALLDLGVGLVSWIIDGIPKALDALGDWLTAIGRWVVDDALPYLQEKTPEWADALWEWVQTDGYDALKQLGVWLESVGTWMVDTALPYLGDKAVEWGTALWEWVQTDGWDAIKKLAEWLGAIGTWITDTALPYLGDKAVQWGGALWEWIQTDGKDAIVQLAYWLGAVGTWITDTAFPYLTNKARQLGDVLWEWINTDGAVAIEKLAEWLGSVANYIRDDLKPAFGDAMAGLVDSLWSWINGDDAQTATDEAAEDLSTNFARSFITELGPALLRVNAEIYEAIVYGMAEAVKEAGKNLAGDFVDGFSDGDFGNIGDFLTRIGTGGTNIKGLVNSALGLIGIPGLAKGGIVTSPTLAMIGEAGPEAVVPLHKLSGMAPDNAAGVTINVNGAIDPVSTAQQIREILNRDASRFGRVTVV